MFFVFLDTNMFQPEEPQRKRIGFDVEDICFFLIALGIVVEILGISFLSAMLTLVGFLFIMLIAASYGLLRAFDYFTNQQSSF